MLKHAKKLVLVFGAVAVLAGAGLAFAQRQERARPGGAPLTWLTAGADEVNVENIDNGVRVTSTVEGERSVGSLQARVAQVVNALGNLPARMAEAHGAAGRRGGPPGVMGLVLAGKVDLNAEDVDNGVAVEFTSDDAEVVQQLRQQVPQAVERAETAPSGRPGAPGMRGIMAQQRNAMNVLAAEGVSVEVAETEKGIQVDVTSENPELAAKIKQDVAAYFDGLQHRSRMMLRMRHMRQQEGAGARGEAGPRGRQRPPRGRGQGRPQR
jgi:hypothetical protein